MPKKKITPVAAGELAKRVEGFSQRFNVPVGQNELIHFQNRCISAIGEYIGSDIDDVNHVTREVCDLVGLSFAGDNFFTSFRASSLYKALTHPSFRIHDDDSLYLWLMILECILNTAVYYGRSNLSFARKIATALKLSHVNAVLCNTSEGYMFYPANAELLDQALVIDVLNWLGRYPKAKEQFDSALRMHLAGDRPRNVIDSLRLSLELFFKQVLGNDVSLENQLSLVGGYLKDRQVSVEIRNMYGKLLDYFTKYNNHNVKHNDQAETAGQAQIEYLIYLTGTFLRFIIQLESGADRAN